MFCVSFFTYLFGAFRLAAFAGDGAILYLFYTDWFRTNDAKRLFEMGLNMSSCPFKDEVFFDTPNDFYDKSVTSYSNMLYGLTCVIGVAFLLFPALFVLSKKPRYNPDLLNENGSINLLDDEDIAEFAEHEDASKRFLRYSSSFVFVVLADIPVLVMVTWFLLEYMKGLRCLTDSSYTTFINDGDMLLFIGPYAGHTLATIGSVTTIIYHEFLYVHHRSLLEIQRSELKIDHKVRHGILGWKIKSPRSHSFAFFIMGILVAFLTLCWGVLFAYGPSILFAYTSFNHMKPDQLDDCGPTCVSGYKIFLGIIMYAGWTAWGILFIVVFIVVSQLACKYR